MVNEDLIAKTENRDYTPELETLVVGTVKAIFEIGKPKIPLTRFRFEITPSIDSGIGPHLDADISAEINGNYEFISHATLLTNCFGDYAKERAGYVRTLASYGNKMQFSLLGNDYEIVLKKEITYSDSNLLGLVLNEALKARNS